MKYFNSYKLFHGKTQFQNCVIVMIIIAAVMTAAGFALNAPLSDFWRGFIWGCFPLACGTLAMIVGFAMLSNVFNANMRTNPGYRFFHSIADGAEHFRRALIAANMLSLIPVIIYTVVGAVLFRNAIIAIMTAAMIVSLGWLNISGPMNSIWAKIVAFMALGFGFGFFTGFADDDFEMKVPSFVLVIVGAVAVTFYLISVIVTVVRAEKLWNKES